MKLTQLLLCKTPFTPSYEHLVTGCSTTEFYNKLAVDPNTITISPVLSTDLQYRTVRETDREVVLELNMVNSGMRPQDYNYIATYEQFPTSRRFWFIESYNVNNSAGVINVTFYCSIDYWHSYILDNPQSVKDQRIVRKKSPSPYVYISDDINVPHDEYLVNHHRILWARARVSTTEFKNYTAQDPVIVDAELGLPYDAGMVTLFIPLIHFYGEDILSYRIGVKFLTAHRVADMNFTTKYITASNTGVALTNYEQYFQIGHVINNLASIATILDLSLTFLPPINFSYTEEDDTITVREDATGLTPVLIHREGYPDMYAFTYFSESHYPFEFRKREIFLSGGEVGYDNIYPYNYYKIYVGGQPFIFSYPVTTVEIEYKFSGSANSAVCDLYVNFELVEKNISICQNIPLPVNVTEADLINARYLNGYREMGMTMAITNGAISAVSGIASIASGRYVSGTVKTVGALAKGVNDYSNAYYQYESQERTPAKQYYPVTEALSALLGDYPYIIKCEINRNYSTMVNERLNIIGHKTDHYDKPIYAPTDSFEFYQIERNNIFSSALNERGNSELMSAFIRGVHLWDQNNNIDNIGIYLEV